jgi:predicted ATPase
MERIQIEGYKSIKTLDLKLNSINILIGSNGSGKSNFLSFFELLKNISESKLKEYVALRGGTDKFLFNGDKITNEINTKLFFKKTNAYSMTLRKGEDAFVFTKEGLWYDNPNYINPVDISSFYNESQLRHSTIPRALFIEKYLKGLAKYHFHDTGGNSPFNKDSHIDNDKFYLYDKGENLAAFLFHIFNEHKIVYTKHCSIFFRFLFCT